MRNIFQIALLVIATFAAFGCSSEQSAVDACMDAQAPLWNPEKKDNSYAGNEKYWNAIKACEQKHKQ